ncbi:hypothetical protein [Caballeronia sp. 15711]|uniref:hypothetical protein n=1 Tax=Caballeronia sp. 15711 TaxID=3391029 RepID=UPI0039E548B5
MGAENVALGLDSNLTRVTELLNGERFTPETAFHIETTLGLQDGFFDQPNPVLSPETIARLKSPLDFIHANAEPEFAYEQVLKSAPAAQVNHHPTLTDSLPREPEMPKKTNVASPRAVAKSTPTAAKPAATTPPKPTSAKVKASSKSGTQQTLPLNDVAALEKIRRANLHVLTTPKGSKVRLGGVMGISASNMANRYYGQKRIDDAEANRFTERLGLPTGWLDIPRTVTDIPESVSNLLASPSPASTQQTTSPAVEINTPGAKKPAAKTKTAGAQLAPPKADRADGPPDPAVQTRAVIAQQDLSAPAAEVSSTQKPVHIDVSLPVVRQQSAPTLETQVIMEPRALPATNLDDLLGIAPIAEALLKTLAGKARTGRLDETKALELLQQIVSL